MAESSETAKVFSTSVEVFLESTLTYQTLYGLLHVRGGVSGSMVGDSSQISSSPRPWRCFFETAPQLNGTFVFSTSVEVFLSRAQSAAHRRSLLHVRGGVSKLFSIRRFIVKVFSTSVEVFPIHRLPILVFLCLLHVRGGVSHSQSFTEPSQSSSPRPWRCFSN